MAIKEIDINNLDFNVFHEIEKYALVTAGDINNFNMMTATGFMCGKFFLKPMVQIYIRPTRYTYKFVESNSQFTVSFYDDKYHNSLVICGNTHGNECNKAEVANLHPIKYDNVVLFEEAKITFICDKVYHSDVCKENFDSLELHDDYYVKQSLLNFNNMTLEKEYSYHRIYMGEIKKIVVSC